jgi:hypothetical protein
VAWGLEHMSSYEFSEWLALYGIEPFGDSRADFHSALICSVLADINTPSGKRRPKIADFMPSFEERPKQSTEEMMAQAAYATLAFDGTDMRERDED